MAEPLLNLTRMMEQAGDDRSLAKELADVFLETSGALVAEMEQALTQTKWSDLARAAHTLKSPLGFFGADESVALAQSIEAQADAANDDNLQKQVSGLQQDVEQLQVELRQYFNQSSDPSP